MDDDLSQRSNTYGMFYVYVIWYVRNIVDQRFQALVVARFLPQLSMCSAFWHVLVHGRLELYSLEVEDQVLWG